MDVRVGLKESWVLKKWCFWTVVFKTLGSPFYCREIQPVHPKGNQSWMFTGRTDAEAETPILWPPDTKNWLIWKDPDAGNDWRQEEKGMAEGEMVGWHYGLDGHEFESALGVGDGQEAWRATVHGVTKSWTSLNVWTEPNWTDYRGSSIPRDQTSVSCRFDFLWLHHLRSPTSLLFLNKFMHKCSIPIVF